MTENIENALELLVQQLKKLLLVKDVKQITEDKVVDANHFEKSGDWTRYGGPVLLQRSLSEDRPITLNTSYYGVLTASTAGAVDYVIGTGLISSVSEWAEFVVTYHQWRVLAMELIYEPAGNLTVVTQPLIWVVDRGPGDQLISYSNAAGHESSEIRNSSKAMTRSIKMDGPDASVWTSTAGAVWSWGFIKMYGNGFNTNQVLGGYLVRFLVQFRGRS